MLQHSDPCAPSGNSAISQSQADCGIFSFGTKAEVLHYLKDRVARSRVEEQVSFQLSEWNRDQAAVVDHVCKNLRGQSLAVRSSSQSEDGLKSSLAGAFTSVLNVDSANRKDLAAAIQQVIRSYPDADPRHQVLVQPMVRDSIAGGVALTRTLGSLAPYYTINFDRTPHGATSITSGSSREHRTLVLHHSAARENPDLEFPLENLLPAIFEIEALLNCDSLDIEFAISPLGCVHILQARPITASARRETISDTCVTNCINQMQQKFRDLDKPGSLLPGSQRGYGIMPDWNPAEIIGTCPGALSVSLYRYLLLDDVWAEQRAEYGYRDVRPQSLLVDFCGRPYIDIRASFNSYIPAGLHEELGSRLVDFYLTRLADNPHLHDKVEFDVLPTCYSLDFDRWHARLKQQGGFSTSEIDQLGAALLAITRSALSRNAMDLANVAKMEQHCQDIADRKTESLDRAFRLLKDCRNLGAKAFAHLARSAFVAICLLRSAIRRRIISQAAMDDFLASVRTVSHSLKHDLAAAKEGSLARETFIARYGHLRPGTYEITSRTYRELVEQLLPSLPHTPSRVVTPQAAGTRWRIERGAFGKALKAAGLSSDLEQVENFMAEAIRGREYAKFAISRNLSMSLDALNQLGADHAVSRKALSNISLEHFRYLHDGGVPLGGISNWLTEHARAGARRQRQAAAVELPPMIFSERDFSCFMLPRNQANYVGSNRVVAECIALEPGLLPPTHLAKGRIILLSQADPGFDWLFSQAIAGLITQYGGANSHMTIRATEHGVPAAIGVGESVFRRLSHARLLELDPGARRIEVIA